MFKVQQKRDQGLLLMGQWLNLERHNYPFQNICRLLFHLSAVVFIFILGIIPQ